MTASTLTARQRHEVGMQLADAHYLCGEILKADLSVVHVPTLDKYVLWACRTVGHEPVIVKSLPDEVHIRVYVLQVAIDTLAHGDLSAIDRTELRRCWTWLGATAARSQGREETA